MPTAPVAQDEAHRIPHLATVVGPAIVVPRPQRRPVLARPTSSAASAGSPGAAQWRGAGGGAKTPWLRPQLARRDRQGRWSQPAVGLVARHGLPPARPGRLAGGRRAVSRHAAPCHDRGAAPVAGGDRAADSAHRGGRDAAGARLRADHVAALPQRACWRPGRSSSCWPAGRSPNGRTSSTRMSPSSVPPRRRPPSACWSGCYHSDSGCSCPRCGSCSSSQGSPIILPSSAHTGARRVGHC